MSPEEAESTIPLATAALCLDCNVVYHLERKTCPRCGSEALILLSQTVLIDRQSADP